MESKKVDEKEEVSMMFLDDEEMFNTDEELALHIYHRFNIRRDTLEDMPAFKEHLSHFFCEEKEK